MYAVPARKLTASARRCRGGLRETMPMLRAYNTYLYNETSTSALKVKPVAPVFSENSPEVPGRQVLRDNWDILFRSTLSLLHLVKMQEELVV
jgi:hypothetical protein